MIGLLAAVVGIAGCAIGCRIGFDLGYVAREQDDPRHRGGSIRLLSENDTQTDLPVAGNDGQND